MKDQQPDQLFSSPLHQVNDFAFDEAVARVFPDMIQRSVPGYTTIIPMIGLLTKQYAQSHSYCYDLGCSLGASTLAMRHGLKESKHVKLVGVDNSEAMIARCNHYIELDNEATPVELKCVDIRELTFQECSVVTLNFTLQFLPISDRYRLLDKIYSALKPGGALILSEKLVFDDLEAQKTLESAHLNFKKANGYSDLEVSQKRSAIENVLVPETLDQHLTRLKNIGFSQAQQWLQCFNFSSILAVK